MSSHALHDGFTVLRWAEGGIGPSTAGLLWSEGVLRKLSFSWWWVRCCGGGFGQPARPYWLSAQDGPLECHRCHRSLLTMAQLEPLHGLIRPVASGPHADAVL